MEKQGPGRYCDFVYHLLGSYNEHVVEFESGTRVKFQGWNGACHRGFQSAQMQCVLITGHPQTDRCDGGTDGAAGGTMVGRCSSAMQPRG